MPRAGLLALLLPGFLLPAQGLAQPGDRAVQAEEQLEALRAEIASIQQRITAQTGDRDAVQDKLRETEIDIARNDRALGQLKQRIGQILTDLAALDRQATELEQSRADLEQQLKDELRSLWALEQGGGLRVLLGDQDPGEIALNLAYYRRLMTAQTTSIEHYESLLADIDSNRQQQRVAQQQLSSQRDALATEQASAKQLAKQRQQTINRINASLSSDNDRIAALEADSKRLTTLLDELRASLSELGPRGNYKAFADAVGELIFPAAGRPRNRFGARRNAGNLRWRGWLIPATAGTAVRAIHHGRVVYSDWLRGQGLLMIVDHGDGWLSLYGQNRSLRAEVGDWVGPGDVIASVGSSGGAASPGLYFEIRKDGEPVDPGKYLRR